ncbi:MgtC/SapB family protein [Candidatus Macondimonas diazotrophica]|uniref:DUF4010 domain-containing protein n=1 Tax=Candidatus Macondimonas diazotrophica TaxID=2305248 RepID=A0A4Z0F9S8_9GAMM|nr:DUF4010 domain-containing protein [Candidatus Macondimonas diazotrophica]NCU00835.1 DUF4010 domain-containing protein [Candidatus Macondimonas diazotrophica]TFZ82566.1 DUF4010 domain-containing protein [Candidatus Macondimonas diazotrophica]HBG30020.1 hypothetical protein [Gammaproteobacteria bacterium]
MQGQTFGHLALALAVGLLIGLERGWQSRTLPEGERIAGLRTFGLLGLLGGVASLLGRELGSVIPAAVILAVTLVMGGAYLLRFRQDHAASATTTIAALVTLGLGGLAGLGELALAAAGAVITTLLLNLKPILHAGVEKLQASELRATLNLLLISVVLLPVLPDHGYGPWAVLNPYRLWMMVVLIASISFGGYFAIKLLGPDRGILFTGLFGGLSSSTAVTLSLARVARSEPAWSPTLASGILVACGTMFPRILLVASVLHPPLLEALWMPLAVMAGVTYGGAALFWWGQRQAIDNPALVLSNPFQLGMALRFGAVLLLILLAAEWIGAQWGARGLYVLAIVSGLSDVDAITLSLARMGQGGLPVGQVVWGILLAASANNLVKTGLALGVGGRAIGRRVAGVLGAGLLLGLAVGFGVNGVP